MMRRLSAKLLVLFPLMVLVSCGGEERPLTWTYRFEGEASSVEARILRGDCEGDQVAYEAAFRVGETPPSPPGLSEGSYGFEIVLRDADCAIVGSTCVEVELPLEEGVSLDVDVPQVAGQACESCDEGLCVGSIDAGIDGGRLDGGPIDLGPDPVDLGPDPVDLGPDPVDMRPVDMRPMDMGWDMGTDMGPSCPEPCLLLWYEMENSPSTGMTDSSTFGFDAARMVGQADRIPGPVGMAFDFERVGGGDVYRVANVGGHLDAPGGFSVAFWVRNPATACCTETLFALEDNTNDVVEVQLTGPGGGAYALRYAHAGTELDIIDLPVDTWIHVAIVWRPGSPGTGTVYLDGAAQPATLRANTNFPITDITLGGELNMSGGPVAPSEADIDDFRYYRGALSEGQIDDLRAMGP